MLDFTTSERRRPSVNLSALIDVAFILVIFVVLSATFRQERDIEVQLPGSRQTTPNSAEGLQVTVFADGHIEIKGERIEAGEVAGALVEARKSHEQVLLIADREANVQAAITVLDLAQAAGFEAVAIASQAETKGGGGS